MSDVGRPDEHVYGLACWSGPAHPMQRAHRHDDIEVNVVVDGRLDYLFGGRRVSIPTGATSVFWAALPHQVVSTESGSRAHWLTVPLGTVLTWRLLEPLISGLLSGEPLLSHPSSSEASTVGSGRGDTTAVSTRRRQQQFTTWMADLAARDPQLEQIALLEMEAYLHRVLRLARPSPHPDQPDLDQSVPDRRDPDVPDPRSTARARSRAASMATFVATRFRDRLSVDDVAAVVHLNPHYAMKVFRDAVGSTIGDYVTQCRVAEAQRLLITTQLTVASIADEAGFGSSSRLYAAFSEAGLPAPGTYRRIQQDAAGRSHR